ncbi:MAG: RND transporter [Deltaproteobacteria bacterium]|nr:RND transporter [Deltaproteobacteria bacterium]
MSEWLDRVPLTSAVLFAATLGLAPFVPMPHALEKLQMLLAGTLSRPIDIFDLFFHGASWLLLGAKLASMAVTEARTKRPGGSQ